MVVRIGAIDLAFRSIVFVVFFNDVIMNTLTTVLDIQNQINLISDKPMRYFSCNKQMRYFMQSTNEISYAIKTKQMK